METGSGISANKIALPQAMHAYANVNEGSEPDYDQSKNSNKISKSIRWRLDIEPANLEPADVSAHFIRANDLFAYHALPAVRKELGIHASNNRVRRRIQFLWDSMPKDEAVKWKASFRKLQEGDMSMVVRSIASGDTTNSSDDVAPGSVKRQKVSTIPGSCDVDVYPSNHSDRLQASVPNMKAEQTGQAPRMTTPVNHISVKAEVGDDTPKSSDASKKLQMAEEHYADSKGAALRCSIDYQPNKIGRAHV